MKKLLLKIRQMLGLTPDRHIKKGTFNLFKVSSHLCDQLLIDDCMVDYHKYDGGGSYLMDNDKRTILLSSESGLTKDGLSYIGYLPRKWEGYTIFCQLKGYERPVDLKYVTKHTIRYTDENKLYS